MFAEIECLKMIPTKGGLSLKENHYMPQIEYPSQCPHCSKSILPIHLASYCIESLKNPYIASIFLCSSCEQFIFTSHDQNRRSSLWHIVKTFPILTETKEFSESISASTEIRKQWI